MMIGKEETLKDFDDIWKAHLVASIAHTHVVVMYLRTYMNRIMVEIIYFSLHFITLSFSGSRRIHFPLFLSPLSR